ncbi:S-crystallin SL11-like [Clytia hemisphaerica]|uniref:Uncharacterized protein n=1 Tax=Clytia hemisphaerica TaxID=252671 RepID=A0A7M5X986_9CNID|eukprot:TCONS_00046042-protein
MAKYTLNYFQLPGRVEPIRLMFHAAGVEFTDNRLSVEEWASSKSDASRFPLHRMPTLEVGGKIYCQSMAIVRFVARELGFYGNNATDQLMIDQLCETVLEMFMQLSSIPYDLEPDVRKAKLEEFFASDKYNLPMGFLTKMLKENQNGEGFFVGDKLSLADFQITGILILLKDIRDIKDEYPEIYALYQRVLNLEKIKKYMDSQKK